MGDDAEVDKVLADAKASLKEIMNGFPDPEEELIEIWETWIERIADGTHVVFLTPMQLMNLKMCFDSTYSELTGKDVPQFVL
jgi:hypothetical protein